MKKTYILFTCFILFTCNIISAQQTNNIPGDIIVMLHSNNEVDEFVASMQTVGGIKTSFKTTRILSQSMHIALFKFDIATINENVMLNAVKRNPLVILAQFNYTAKERIAPNDPNYTNGNMWDMNNTGQNSGVNDADIDAPEAWDITTGGLTAQGDTIVVAVVDGGFDLTQQDLNFWKNRNEIPGNGIDDDGNGYIDDVKGWDVATSTDNITSASHGTHVCGTVGARGNNGIGVTGVNWNVRIMPIMYGSAQDADVVVAYSYAMDNRRLYNQTNGQKGAFVVSTNSSFGIDLAQASAHPLWCAMYDSLGSVGILSACATANANYNVDTQGDIPTACASNWMISVTNTTRTDAKNSSCGYGLTTIDLGAPGTTITSSLPGNTYGTMSGTSMATPHVAGCVALMYSVQCSQFIANYKTNPGAVALMVKDSLLNATDPNLDLNNITVSGGRLNLFKSVKSMQNYCATVDVSDIETRDSNFGLTNIYPNPAENSLTVVYNSYQNVEIIFTDLLGQQIRKITDHTSTKGVQHSQIDVKGMAKGIYFVSLRSQDKISNVMKVTIQ